jgi:hypothetical protein
MYADRVFEFGVVLATSIGVDSAAHGGAQQDAGCTLDQRSLSRVEPHR